MVPAAIGFGVGAVAYVVVALAVFARQRWAWWFALIVNIAAFATATNPIRNFASIVAAITSALAIIVLLVPATRRAMRA